MLWLRIIAVAVLLSPMHCRSEEPDAARIQNLIAGLNSDDEEIRGENVRQLGQFGPEARDAIPALIQRLKDRGAFVPPLDPDFPGMGFVEISIRTTAMSALEGMGLEAAPALGAALNDDNFLFQLAVLQVLGKVGPRTRTELERITPLVSSANKVIRREAVDTLLRVDRGGNVAIPVIQQLMEGKDENLRQRAVGGLANYPRHPLTMATLETALKSTDPAVRGEAAWVLSDLRGPSDRIVELLLPLIRDEGHRMYLLSNHSVAQRRVCDEAIEGLLRHKVPASKLLPEFLKTLEKQGYMNFDSEQALQNIPRLTPAILGTAEHVFKYFQGAHEFRRHSKMKDEDWSFGPEFEAVKCLARLPEQTRAVIPQLKELFLSKDEYVRAEAAAILAAIDPESNEKAVNHALHIIELLFTSTDPNDLETVKELLAERNERFPDEATDGLRETIILALCSNENLAEKLLPKLIEWYRVPNTDWTEQGDVLRNTFQRLGPKAKHAGPALVENIDNFFVPDVIVALGPDMVPLLAAKAKVSQNGDRWRGLKALRTLAKFGNHAAPALPIFFEYLNSPDAQFRVAVIEFLGELSSLPDEVVPELIKRLHDERCIVRSAAASHLGNFTVRSDTIIPALTVALTDDYADVRASALESLLKLGLKHSGVRDAVRSAQQDRHPYVRLLANEALEK